MPESTFWHARWALRRGPRGLKRLQCARQHEKPVPTARRALVRRRLSRPRGPGEHRSQSGNGDRPMSAANALAKKSFNEGRNFIDCPSLYDVVPECLGEKLGPHFDRAVIRIDDPHRTTDEAMQAWTTIYRARSDRWELFKLAKEACGPERLLPPPAFQPRHQSRAHHRPEARHRRSLGRELPAQDAKRRAFPELWNMRGQL